MTNEEYINQIIEIGNTLQIQPNSPKGQTLKKCIEVLSADSVKTPKNGERFSCPNCGFKADWFIPSKQRKAVSE